MDEKLRDLLCLMNTNKMSRMKSVMSEISQDNTNMISTQRADPKRDSHLL